MENVKGLSQEEVIERINDGRVNNSEISKTKTIKEIFLSNIFTYFNILNIFLAAAIIVSGIIFNKLFYSLKNCLFLGVIICNTTISIVQEVMSKKTIDKLSILSSIKPKVLRDDKILEINIQEIVLDDVIIYELGSQVVVDSEIISGEVEVNESFITEGDTLISGSFIVSGKVYAKVIHVGNDNYINTISNETKKIENNKSVIFNSFEKLVRILSYILIPLGTLLFINQYYFVHVELSDAIINTVAALIGMIPEGLVLLTSSVMAVSVIRLSRDKVLVQQLYCIETLARVNVICLDKTGTITTGKMKVNNIISDNRDNFEKTITKLLNVLPDNSGTFMAIRDKYEKKEKVLYEDIISFSSERKFSACRIDGINYYVGAPEYILEKESISDEIKDKQVDFRVLVIAHNNKSELSKNPHDLVIDGYILIEDEIRREASDTLKYFKEQGVTVKIISGDNYKTVKSIASRVGLKNLKGIDTTDIDIKSIPDITSYDIYGRVTPYMKKEIICALKKDGYTVCMTGDGVNDVLALRE